MRVFKLLFINLLILFFLVILIELLFGAWIFKKNNLKNLNIPNDISIQFDIEGLYKSDKYIITYTRDKYGLRGLSTFNKPEKIDILTIGGSTTDQEQIDDNYTWQEVLEKELKQHNQPLKVSNAGIDGQSTLGCLKNFELWFPIIPNLKPKYVLFYVGINDFYYSEDNSNMYDHLEEDSTIEIIKNKSAIFNLLRKIKGIYLSKRSNLSHYKIDMSKEEYTTEKLIDFTPKPFLIKISNYKKRVKNLILESKLMGANPIFITQPSRLYKFLNDTTVVGTNKSFPFFDEMSYNGLDYYYFTLQMNAALKEVCQNYNVQVIDLTNFKKFDDEDFYDYYHNTPSGTKKIGEEIAKHLIPLLKESR